MSRHSKTMRASSRGRWGTGDDKNKNGHRASSLPGRLQIRRSNAAENELEDDNSDRSYNTAPELASHPPSPTHITAEAKPANPSPLPLPSSPLTVQTEVSKKLRIRDLTPGRLVHVQNPSRERSWRGHPGLILAVHGRRALIITLTSWAGRTCAQKWSGSEDPAKYRRWFMLVQNGDGARVCAGATSDASNADADDSHDSGGGSDGGRALAAPNHDGVPIVKLRHGCAMPKLSYVDCKRTHWLDVAELRKYCVPGVGTNLSAVKSSVKAIKKHLEFLATLESPWIEGIVAEDQTSPEPVRTASAATGARG